MLTTNLKEQDFTYLNNLSIIDQVTDLKEEVDSIRPLTPDQEGRIMQKFRLDWNYNSNAIEGNSLDYGETVAFLMHGVTAKGKPLKDYLDIRGHNNAIDFLRDFVRKEEILTERDIRALHELLLVEPYDSRAQTQDGQAVTKRINLGQYKTTPNHVVTVTGETHYYASVEDTPIFMAELVDWYREISASKIIHPVVLAALFHHRFVAIHPFDDGNGRMTRLLMNLILMQNEYPVVVVRNDDKSNYYLALSQADTGELDAFVEYIAQNMVHSLNTYIKGAKGESIDDPTDLDKKLSLFMREIEGREDKVEVRRSKEVQDEIVLKSIIPIFNQLEILLGKFKPFFLDYTEHLIRYMAINPHYIYKQWNYNKTTINNNVLRDIFLYSEASPKRKVLSFILSNFKTISNPFSIELKIAVSFNDLNYTVYYAISTPYNIDKMSLSNSKQWLGSPIIDNFYHQTITNEQSDLFISSLGSDLYNVMTGINRDPSLFDTKFDYENLDEYWSDFLNTIGQVDGNDIPDFNKSVVLHSGLKLIFSDDESQNLYSQSDKIANEFKRFLLENHYSSEHLIIDAEFNPLL